MLDVRNLSKRFGGLSALMDISFEVGAGEIVSLIGPNGAGKTTCLNLITDHGKSAVPERRHHRSGASCNCQDRPNTNLSED
jgi:ABC-type branched-subunit amino acid transport system ATPase component